MEPVDITTLAGDSLKIDRTEIDTLRQGLRS